MWNLYGNLGLYNCRNRGNPRFRCLILAKIPAMILSRNPENRILFYSKYPSVSTRNKIIPITLHPHDNIYVFVNCSFIICTTWQKSRLADICLQILLELFNAHISFLSLYIFFGRIPKGFPDEPKFCCLGGHQ